MNRIASEMALVMVIAACLLIGSCAEVGFGVGVGGAGGGVGVGVSGVGAGGGRQYLSGSNEVVEEFEKAIVRPNYQYYYSGSDAHPAAILGLDRRYALTNDLWKPVPLTPAKLKDWVDDMQRMTVFTPRPLHGFWVLDGAGNRIGVWYSVLGATSTVRVKPEPENRIWIDTPPPDVYHEFDQDRLRPRF